MIGLSGAVTMYNLGVLGAPWDLFADDEPTPSVSAGGGLMLLGVG